MELYGVIQCYIINKCSHDYPITSTAIIFPQAHQDSLLEILQFITRHSSDCTRKSLRFYTRRQSSDPRVHSHISINQSNNREQPELSAGRTSATLVIGLDFSSPPPPPPARPSSAVKVTHRSRAYAGGLYYAPAKQRLTARYITRGSDMSAHRPISSSLARDPSPIPQNY